MDFLNKLIASKKEQTKTQSSSWVRRADAQQQEKEKEKEAAPVKDTNNLQIKEPLPVDNTHKKRVLEEIQTPAEQEDQPTNMDVNKRAVIWRLRQLNQPVTLFGESDEQRFVRLQESEEKLASEHRALDRNGLPKLDEERILKKLQQINQNQSNAVEETKQDESSKPNVDEYVGRYHSHKDLRIGDRDMSQMIETCERNNKKFLDVKKFENQCRRHPKEEKCHLVMIWCRKMLNTWETRLLAGKDEAYIKTTEGRVELGKHQTCYRQVRPLLKLLKSKKVPDAILDSLYLVVQYCMMKEYIKAHDKYVGLAIGNAPWPMGVTMVGIHERSGRSKIFTSQQAHVLNDETQRKYIQAFKRLLTVCQNEFPTDPSRQVST